MSHQERSLRLSEASASLALLTLVFLFNPVSGFHREYQTSEKLFQHLNTIFNLEFRADRRVVERDKQSPDH